MLVAAVLGPEQREDRELEVIRLALEQVDDARVLPVGQAEGPVEGVFGDLRQAPSVPVPSDAFAAGGSKRRAAALEKTVSRRHLLMLLALAAIWGSSFMLIEIALRDLDPATLILLRLGSAALALVVYVALTGLSFAPLRPFVWPLALMGVLNTALPFYLITWGQQYIDSGLAAILNASAPLFTAHLRRGRRPGAARHRPAARRA